MCMFVEQSAFDVLPNADKNKTAKDNYTRFLNNAVRHSQLTVSFPKTENKVEHQAGDKLTKTMHNQ